MTLAACQRPGLRRFFPRSVDWISNGRLMRALRRGEGRIPRKYQPHLRRPHVFYKIPANKAFRRTMLTLAGNNERQHHPQQMPANSPFYLKAAAGGIFAGFLAPDSDFLRMSSGLWCFPLGIEKVRREP